MSNILYLGSKSYVRQKLLREAGIAIKVLGHNSDECIVKTGLGFDEYVLEVAREKMRHVVMPHLQNNETIFILTADSLVKTQNSKQIFGKPDDIEDGKRMLRAMRDEPVVVTTGCCIHKVTCEDGNTRIVDRKEWATRATIEFCVFEDELDIYFSREPDALKSAGAGILESGYGLRFLKNINGSYSAALGLPMFEVCQTLKAMGF
jgi:septum formation protein